MDYVRTWATATTAGTTFPSSNGLTDMVARVLHTLLNVTMEAADVVVQAKFRFPMKSNANKVSKDTCISYMKRSISDWHFKTKGTITDFFLKRLIVDKEVGHWIVNGRQRVVALYPHEALKLLTNNNFFVLPTCFTAVEGAIFDFIESQPLSQGMIVPRSETVPSSLLRLYNAQFAWFIKKVTFVRLVGYNR